MKLDPLILNAHRLAVQAREYAYAPYSNFKVGAAIKLKKSDEIITGCNIENVSFGATNCAERTAIFSAMAKHKKSEIEFVIVVSDLDNPVSPCGLCLQVISEFSQDATKIYIANTKSIVSEHMLRDLLPNPFTNFLA